MSSDKSNIYPFDCKLDDYDKTMVLPTNVEHIMLIADIIDIVETLFTSAKHSHCASFTIFTQFCKAVLVSGNLAM